MAIPTWTVGEVLTAADVNAWFVPLAAIRTSNGPQIKTTAATNDAVLFVPVAINASYMFTFLLYAASASTTSGAQFNFTGPAGCFASYSGAYDNASGGSFGVPTSIGTVRSGLVGGTANANYSSRWYGTLQTAGTAGNFQVQYYEQTLDASNGAYVLNGSALVLHRIG